MFSKIEDTYDYEISNDQAKSWYQAKPYCFRIGKNSFYLPISPSNLTISTPFATNIVATLYGVVEEHSEQKYYDIVVSGTTGLAPKNYKYVNDEKTDSNGSTQVKSTPKKTKISFASVIKKASQIVGISADTKKSIDANDPTSSGRLGYPVSNASLGGFFSKTTELLKGIVSKVKSIANEIKSNDSYESGIDSTKSGYIAFHNLYRFLLSHKKNVLTDDIDVKRQPIQFINYKDNNQYDVAIRNFQVVKSVDDPMLYKYTITMRGYNLSKITPKEGDTFEKRLADLGLSGVDNSIKSKLSNVCNTAKGTLSSAISLAKGFGR